MSKESAQERSQRKIRSKRKDVEEALGFVGRSVERELSFMPSGRRWLLPTVAFAVGVALSGAGKAPARSFEDPANSSES